MALCAQANWWLHLYWGPARASAKRAFSKEHRGARSPDAMSRTFSQSRGSSSKELRAISILPNDAVLVATSK